MPINQSNSNILQEDTPGPVMPAPVQPQPETAPVAAEQPSTKGGRKKKFLIIIGLIVTVIIFLIGSGLVLAGLGYITLPISLPFFDEDPVVVLGKAFDASTEIKSSQYMNNFGLTLELDQSAMSSFGSSLAMFGLNGGGDKSGASSVINLNLNTEGDWFKGDASLQQEMQIKGVFKWEGLSMEFDVEAVSLEDKFYFIVNQLPPIPFLSMILGDMQIKGQWYLIDPVKIQEGLGELSGGPISVVFAERLNSGLGQQVTEELKLKLESFFKEHVVIFDILKLESEEVNGVKSYHYALDINPANLRTAIVDGVVLLPELLNMLEIMNDDEMTEALDAFAENLEEKKGDVEELLAEHFDKIIPHLEALDIEIWIGKKDYYVRRLEVAYIVPQESLAKSTEPEGEGFSLNIDLTEFLKDVRVQLDFEMTNINKPVNIQPPTDAIDLYEDIIKPMQEESGKSSRDSKRITNLKLLQSSIEVEAAGILSGLYVTGNNWNDLKKGVIELPSDSPDQTVYCYYINEDQTKYILSTELEKDESVYSLSDSSIFDLNEESYKLISSSSDNEGCIKVEPGAELDCSQETTYCLSGAIVESNVVNADDTGELDGAKFIDSVYVSKDEFDSDNDGLTNEQEETYGTDPFNPDSDGDGFLDGDEVNNGYNPLGEGKMIQ